MKSYIISVLLVSICWHDDAYTMFKRPRRSSNTENISPEVNHDLDQSTIPTHTTISRTIETQVNDTDLKPLEKAKIEDIYGYPIQLNCRTNKEAQYNITIFLQAANTYQYDSDTVARYLTRLQRLQEYDDAPQISDRQQAIQAALIDLVSKRIPMHMKHIMNDATPESDQ